MSGEINEVSAALGRLEAMSAEGVRDRAELFKTVSEISRCVAKMSAKFDTLATGIEAAAKTANEAHAMGTDWKNTKTKALAAVFGFGGGAGVGGNFLVEWLKAKLGGGG